MHYTRSRHPRVHRAGIRLQEMRVNHFLDRVASGSITSPAATVWPGYGPCVTSPRSASSLVGDWEFSDRFASMRRHAGCVGRRAQSGVRGGRGRPTERRGLNAGVGRSVRCGDIRCRTIDSDPWWNRVHLETSGGSVAAPCSRTPWPWGTPSHCATALPPCCGLSLNSPEQNACAANASSERAFHG